MKVCFVAAPLTARTGVYRSGRELVEAGRSLGYDWRLVVGVSGSASGSRADPVDWATEFIMEPAGLTGIAELLRALRLDHNSSEADAVVSLIPQTDMALALRTSPWVAFVRGMPWPAPGESSNAKRWVWEGLERLALRRATEVWATTPILRDQFGFPGTRIVPAGIASVRRTWDGIGERSLVVWAARFDLDKRPALFAEIMAGSTLGGVMYGSGPLEAELQRTAPGNVHVAGWVDAADLWRDALVYVGTSSREAFGRSAVEAAMNGVPIVISRDFGCADLLVTKDDFARQFLMESDSPDEWRVAIESLRADDALRSAYSDHLVQNAQRLTIESSAKAVAARLAHLNLTGGR